MPFSNAIFATPYYNETFECFAEGSVLAFKEFKGIAQFYRLDNLTPAVSKILKRGRKTTEKFNSFQKYYGFKVHFCNPRSGWEKGTVESNNKHFKKRLTTKISLNNLSFTSLQAFQNYVHKECRSYNKKIEVSRKFAKEPLCELPRNHFETFQSCVSRVNKYSTLCLDNDTHRYSVPSEYIGCRLEVRAYPTKIEIVDQNEVIAVHERLFGSKKKASIQVEHIIEQLCKKPGAALQWKYKAV